MHTKRQELLHLLATRALKRGSFILSSGIATDHRYDCEEVAKDEIGSILIGEFCTLELVGWDDRWPAAIGGLERGASLLTVPVANEVERIYRRRPPAIFSVLKNGG